MANTITSPNMTLMIPVTGVDPGPDYANNVNAALATIDNHDHSPGKGVQVTPAGLSISSDLTFQSNNAINLRSARFTVQTPPIPASGLDLGCIYVSGVDLYFNDENGNQIQITKNGGVAGASGTITGLTSPASASYISGSGTFVWQSDASTAANMDNASVTIRKQTVSSPGITISAPSSLSSNYTLTLPPAVAGSSQSFLTEDTAGNISNAVAVDNSTIGISSNLLEVKPGGITTTQISSTAGILGSQLSASAGILGSQLVSSPMFNGDAQTSGQYLVRQDAGSPLKIVRGSINADGSINLGSGFTSSYNSGTKTYTVVFGTAFSAAPTVVCTPIQPVTSSFNPSITVIATSTTQFTAWGSPNSGSITEVPFGFIAIGPT